MRRVHGQGAAGPDPDYAPTVEVFDRMHYDEIYRGVLQMNPEVLTAGRQAWQSAAAGLGDAVQQAHAEIRGAIADGWRGSAAQQAAAAMQAFEELGQHVADVMSAVSQRLGQANDAAETLRGAVSRPVAVGADLEAALLDPKRATLNIAAQKQAEGLRQDVVRVMDTVYAGAFVPTGNSVPAFPQGGMYPAPEEPAPPPGGEPGPDATDSLTAPGAVAVPEATVPQAVTVPGAQGSAAESDSPAEADEPVDAGADTGAEGAAVTVPAAAPAAPTAPATVSDAPVVPAADRPASVAPTAAANTVVPQAVPAASATPVSAPVTVAAAAGAATTAQSSEDQRKRDERDQRHEPASDAVGGMGAGVFGGLAGSALAAGDAVRSGPGVPVPPKRSQYDEDEDEEYYDFDEPTYLEPAEPGTELVGQLDPTTPPVVGEWAEDY
ncbi:PPE domain-containing protein [Nocardia blacklockiae]|uniref:PPE domain-containing protein n=1 Tax=Nocardia blacklockiae TaxID=480036 RepID=UPI0018954004|nr:WXG100 family type VII secretion target [Nocardia blacklockiae]MBF6174556.1 WXG100 family type VII secretion target [Nocardia blacklockiae]